MWRKNEEIKLNLAATSRQDKPIREQEQATENYHAYLDIHAVFKAILLCLLAVYVNIVVKFDDKCSISTFLRRLDTAKNYGKPYLSFCDCCPVKH